MLHRNRLIGSVRENICHTSKRRVDTPSKREVFIHLSIVRQSLLTPRAPPLYLNGKDRRKNNKRRKLNRQLESRGYLARPLRCTRLLSLFSFFKSELSQWNDIKWCVKQRVYARTSSVALRRNVRTKKKSLGEETLWMERNEKVVWTGFGIFRSSPRSFVSNHFHWLCQFRWAVPFTPALCVLWLEGSMTKLRSVLNEPRSFPIVAAIVNIFLSILTILS